MVAVWGYPAKGQQRGRLAGRLLQQPQWKVAVSLVGLVE